jgi:hypothetical protein
MENGQRTTVSTRPLPLANTPDVGKENEQKSFAFLYTIDPILQSDQQFTPDHLRDDPTQRSSHFIRQLTFAECSQK